METELLEINYDAMQYDEALLPIEINAERSEILLKATNDVYMIAECFQDRINELIEQLQLATQQGFHIQQYGDENCTIIHIISRIVYMASINNVSGTSSIRTTITIIPNRIHIDYLYRQNHTQCRLRVIVGQQLVPLTLK